MGKEWEEVEEGEKKEVTVPFLTSANTRWKQPGELAYNAQTQKKMGMVAHICILALRSSKISVSSGLTWTT